MICAELEKLENDFDDILNALEDPDLTEEEKRRLNRTYAELSRIIRSHREHGHDGGPCFEEE